MRGGYTSFFTMTICFVCINNHHLFFIQIVIFFTICYGFLFNSKILFFSFPVQMYIRSLLFTATIM